MKKETFKKFRDSELKKMLEEITSKKCSGAEIQKAWEITKELRRRGFKIDLILRD